MHPEDWDSCNSDCSEGEWEPPEDASEVDEFEGHRPCLVSFLDGHSTSTVEDLLDYLRLEYNFDLSTFTRDRAPREQPTFYSQCALINYLTDLKLRGEMANKDSVMAQLAAIHDKSLFWTNEKWLVPQEGNQPLISALIGLAEREENAEADAEPIAAVMGQPVPSQEFLAEQARIIKSELERMERDH